MTSPTLNHEQMSANGASGDNSHRGATGNRWQAPVRVTPLRWQDSLECPHLPGTLSPNQLGRGLRGSGPFQFPNPTVGVSSPLTRAGRQAVERMSYTRSGLPFLCFKATDHQACKLIDPSPFVAHQCAPFAASNHAAKGVVNVQYPAGEIRNV